MSDSRNWPLPVCGLALGILVAGLALWLGQRVGTDSAAFWDASRTVLHGGDPYARQLTDWPNFYPLPAYLVLAPLAVLPSCAFHLACAGLSGLALGVAARARPALAPALLSAGFFQNAAAGQWGTVMLAAIALPALSWAWSLKPSVGLACFVGFPRRSAAIFGLLLLALAFSWEPGWVAGWLTSLKSAPHVAPILRPGGFLLLLAFVSWRIPEARLLGMLALVPHSVSVGDALLGFAACRTKWEGYAVAALSYVAAFAAGHAVDPSMTLIEAQARQWPAIAVGCYLPALVLVLRR